MSSVMALFRRSVFLVALLAVPLMLAIASQQMAERPGPPDMPPGHSQIDISPAGDGGVPVLPTSPTDDPAPPASASGSAPTSSGQPAVTRVPALPVPNDSGDGDGDGDGDGADDGS